MRLPPLKALVCFEAVARLNSFSQAAHSLNVSQSAVSHQVRQLEEHLGEPLFVRHGRYLSLTDEGRTYYDSVAEGLARIERATDRFQGHNEDSRVRVALFSSFAVRWLIPRLPELQARQPGLDVSLQMTSESPAMSDRVADCFITLHAAQRGYTADLLYSERLFAICSRRFWVNLCADLRSRGLIGEDEPETLDADWLQDFPLLSTYSLFGDTSEDWRRWLAADGTVLKTTARLQHFSHMLLALEAARHHQGIALSNDYMVSVPDDPDLVRLPCHTMKTGDQFYFAFKTSRRHESGLRLLRQWVRQQAVTSGLLDASHQD